MTIKHLETLELTHTQIDMIWQSLINFDVQQMEPEDFIEWHNLVNSVKDAHQNILAKEHHSA